MDIGVYKTHQAPLHPPKDMPLIEMSKDELRRFCTENKLPMFTLKVEVISTYPGITESIDKPYLRHITFFNGAQFEATEQIKCLEVPCPACGKSKQVVSHPDRFFVQCRECGNPGITKEYIDANSKGTKA